MVLPVGGDAERQKSLQMDEKTSSQFVQWLRGLPKDAQILRVFDRKNDGFFVHDRDAYYVARTFYKSTTMVSQLKIKVGGKDEVLDSIHLNRSMFEALLQDVLVTKSNRVVELYEGHGSTWQIARKASPGQLANFEEELFKSSDMVDAPVIMSAISKIADGVRTVGIAYVDSTSRRLGATQFDDDDQLCALERVLVQLGAKECVIPQDSTSTEVEMAKLEQLCSECDVLVSRKPKATFNGKDVKSSFETLLKDKSSLQHEHILERPLACSALAGVLKFSEISSDSDNHGRFHLELYNPENLMRLDKAAQSALHVFPARTGARSSSSIYGILNHSRTAMGKRLLRSWLKQPLTDVSAIQERHQIVKIFVDDVSLRKDVRDSHLRGIPDIQRLSRKLAARKVTLQELCQMYMASVQLTQLVGTLAGYEGDNSNLLQERFAKELEEAHTDDTLVKFEQLMENAVDLEAVPEEYLIDAGYSADLQEVKDARDEAIRALENEAKKVADDLDLELDKTAKLEWFKSNNVSLRCLRITPKEEKTRRAKLNSKYIVLESRKDGTKFTSKKMRDFANSIFEHTQRYSKIQSDLLQSVRDVAATFTHIWERVGDILAELDVLVSFAHAAATASTPYVCPEMLGGEIGEITLKQSRHPCLEMQEGIDVIPNDCVMQRGDSWFHIITGPNMGGKSTFIRQVGVCVLMAQVGSFVPCDEARISVRDCIFARVGAGDCQQKGVSTFMAEMLETAAIMKGASEKSLLIIDELGRGTSTYDGFGLAWALSEHIMQVIGAPTLFATHFHELTSIKGVVGVKNCHMKTMLDLESSKLTMLYNVADGACDQSFGIHVAEFAGFPEEILQNARSRLAELEAGGMLGSQAGGKRSRADLESGSSETRAALQQFLKDFAEAPLSDPETAAEQLGTLKKRLLQQSEENDELKNVLSSLGVVAH